VIAPVLRFSRDKRGYEHFYLVQSVGRRGKARPRVIYWFRTPPHVKVGRQLFDPDVRRALERQFPNTTFEWKKLLETPVPPPDTSERWRENRRLKRAAKARPVIDREAASEEAAAGPALAVSELPSEPGAGGVDVGGLPADPGDATTDLSVDEAGGGGRDGAEP
jgi:hypothetical protein